LITSSVKAKEKVAAKVIETNSDPKACQNQQSLCLTEECIVSGIFLYGLYSVNLISQNDMSLKCYRYPWKAKTDWFERNQHDQGNFRIVLRYRLKL